MKHIHDFTPFKKVSVHILLHEGKYVGQVSTYWTDGSTCTSSIIMQDNAFCRSIGLDGDKLNGTNQHKAVFGAMIADNVYHLLKGAGAVLKYEGSDGTLSGYFSKLLLEVKTVVG